MTVQLLRFLALSLLLLLFSTTVWATHNRAGEIVVEMVPDENGNCGLTVKATIITYTKTSSVDADRDSLTICWDANGPCERVARMNGPGNPPQGVRLENDIKFNIYMATHSYNGPGTYTISFEDPNRNAGVLNVNFPNSVSIPFYVENVFTIVNPAVSGCNNSPVLQVPPIDFACMGEVFTHNPGAFDVDGDSLVYELTIPQQGPNDPVPNFVPQSPSVMSIDRLTGDLVWDSPNAEGEYNFAINIISFRNGQALDTMVRDMQIIVENCSNEPPVVVTDIEEICVIAGTLLEFDITATAPITDTDQRVRLLAYGAPFSLGPIPAELIPPSEAYFDDPLVKTFRWQTDCEHISDQYYNVVFRAVDDFLGDSTGLATLKTVRIKVVGPPPEDVQAVPNNQTIEVSWQLPYDCEETDNDYFRGFSIWRRINSNQMELDSCAPGLEGLGYTKISTDTVNTQLNGRYFFLDENAERGRTYCYRILANFAQTTTSGFFYNRVVSLPSKEACVQLGRDVPLLTKVDVLTTDFTDGQIDVCWSKPDPEDLDTLQNPGPYTYELLRAEGHAQDPSAFSPIFSTTAPTFATANDTCFIDLNLNTVDQPYTYFLNFYVNGETDPIGNNSEGGSVYLNASPTDRTNILFWDELVPWFNYSYTIFKENNTGGLDSITTVSDPIYRDEGLLNGTEYCYVVRSEGTYNIEGLPDQLFNRSQRKCSTPIDNIPPCAPVLTVTNLCDEGGKCDDMTTLENNLSWEGAATLCPEFEDIASYNIYYATTVGLELSLIATVDDPDLLNFTHQPMGSLAGCYAVTAIDTVGNESPQSNIVCVDNCPSYELPNVFTPNGDGQNDLYIPRRSCFIASVEFEIYNRWGALVFETTDPNLNWDGTNSKGEQLAESTYFYKCRVFEQRVDGVIEAPEILSGYIELLRGQP
jgi:gliding motility-associated-like protein